MAHYTNFQTPIQAEVATSLETAMPHAAQEHDGLVNSEEVAQVDNRQEPRDKPATTSSRLA